MEKCDSMIRKLSVEKILGVDVEYWAFDASRGAICLIQISNGANDYIIDML